MATYVIGDLQGCHATLQALLETIAFERARDRLWFVGDLVNRGAGSLECLRFVRALGDRAVTVLGNHDLTLLAVDAGSRKPRPSDTLDAILAAPDRTELIDWLRTQKLLHVEGDFVMVHAGLLPAWDLSLAERLAGEVERALRGADYRQLLANMYGDEPAVWRDDLAGFARLRLAINAFTRMRAVSQEGRLELGFKGEPADMPRDQRPWFAVRHPSLAAKTIVAGHWSALGLYRSTGFVGLDTGCVWGRSLTALRLEDMAIFQTPSVEPAPATGWD